MPTTYTLIASSILSSSTVTVTFSSIPATYTDLVLQYSSRISNASADYYVVVRLNGDTSTNYSNTRISGNGVSVSSPRNSNVDFGYGGVNTGAGATANTFGNNEIYIPNYQMSSNKPFLTSATMENNATTSLRQEAANLWRSVDPVTSVSIVDPAGNGFVSGSSFFLYGIKNS